MIIHCFQNEIGRVTDQFPYTRNFASTEATDLQQVPFVALFPLHVVYKNGLKLSFRRFVANIFVSIRNRAIVFGGQFHQLIVNSRAQ